MPNITALDLLNQRGNEFAQLFEQGQQGQLRRLQMEQALEDRAKRSKLQELMTQAAQGAITQPQALPDLLGVSSYRPDVANQIWGAGADKNYDYGNRPDGSKKGTGFLGLLKIPGTNKVATEYSVGVNINGKEMDIPTLVPTLSQDEVQQVLMAAKTNSDVPENIIVKAADYARNRLAKGMPVFAGQDESPQQNYPDLQAWQQAWEQRANIPTMTPGGFDPGKFSDLLMRSGDPDAITQGLALKKSLAGEGFTLGEGQVRYGAGGQEIARGPAKAPKEVSRWSEPFSMGGATVQKNLDTQEIRTAVSRPPITNVNVGSPKETFKNERDLRNDFQGLPTTKAFREVQTSFDQINYALNNPSAAGDLAAATKFMKLLDPGSVVRESELGMAMAATGKFDQLSNYYNMLKTGEKLTTSQRKDFKNLAKGLYDAAAGRYNETAAEYQNLAQQYDLNPERIAKTVKTVGTAKPRDIAPAKNFLNAATTQDDLAKRVKSLKNKGWSDEEIKQAYGD